MTAIEGDRRKQPTPAEYIRANFQSTDRIAVLVRNRKRSETIQRIATVDKVAWKERKAITSIQIPNFSTNKITVPTHEEIVCLGTKSTNCEQLHEVEELTMNVAADLSDQLISGHGPTR